MESAPLSPENEYPFYSEKEFKKKIKTEKKLIKTGKLTDTLSEEETQLIAENKVETQVELDPKKGYEFGTAGWTGINNGMTKADTIRRELSDIEEEKKEKTEEKEADK